MDFAAGIDGGGTRTRVLCRDREGREEQRDFGPFNLNSIGPERFGQLLDELTAYLAARGRCRAVCIGAAGVSNRTMVTAVEQAMDKAGISSWKLVGDHVIALQGALSGRPGLAFIAGTGSICFGRGPDGREERAGGWGHLIGDEGSAYALGRAALSAVARAWDGWGEETALTGLLLGELGLHTRQKLISHIYGGDKTRVASLAPLVDRAAAQGDRAAVGILEENAQEMAAMVRAVALRLDLPQAPVAMLGGLLEHDTCLRRAFISAMGVTCPGCTCILPEQDALHGALLMAEKEAWQRPFFEGTRP